MKMNLRNISWAMGLVLLGSVAMPSLARKKKVQPVQKPAVQEDHRSPNDRQRYNYFFLEGARQQAAGGAGSHNEVVESQVAHTPARILSAGSIPGCAGAPRPAASRRPAPKMM